MSSQDYRPKDKAFWEARNSLTLRSIWENVIADGLDEVQIVTQSMHPVVGSIAYQDLLYRAGSSACAALPSCAASCANGEARCRLCPGEPMWLKR